MCGRWTPTFTGQGSRHAPDRAPVTINKNVLAGIEAAAAKAYADSQSWQRLGFRSAEEWMASKTGTSTGGARKGLDTAKRMEKQENVKEAVAEGRLSPEQAEKIADAVDADPSAEDRLLRLAEHASLRELGEECDRTKVSADPDPDATYRRIHHERVLRFWTQAGVAQMLARCTPAQMAAIKAAVECRAQELFLAARRSGEHQAREAYLMDALERICREWMGEPAGEDAASSIVAAPARSSTRFRSRISPRISRHLRQHLPRPRRGRNDAGRCHHSSVWYGSTTQPLGAAT